MAKSPKKRRRYPWILGVVLAVGIVAVIFGPELMPTEWVRRLTKSFISDSLRQALHEKVYVSLDEVEWRRWNRLQLRNLAIIRTKGEKPILTISEVGLHVHLWDLIHKQLVVQSLKIKRPVVNMDREAFAHLNLKLPTPASQEGMSLAVEALQVQQAMLTITDGPLTIFQASDLGVRAVSEQGEPLRYDMSLNIRSPAVSGRVRSNGQLVAFPGSDPGLVLDDLSLTASPFLARAKGKVIFAQDGPRIELLVTARAPAKEVNRFLQAAAHQKGDMVTGSGVFDFESRIEGPVSDLTVRGFLDAPPCTLRMGGCAVPVGAWPKDIEYSLRLRENEVDINAMTCRLPMGTVSASGKITGLKSSPIADLKLSVPDLDAQQVYEQACKAAGALPAGWKVAGKVRSDVSLVAENGQCKVKGSADLAAVELVGLGGLALKPARSPWELRFDLALDKDSVSINEGTSFKGDIFLIQLAGRVLTAGAEPTVDITAKSDMDVGQAFRRWARACLELPDGLDAAGRLHTTTRVSGKPSDLTVEWVNDSTDVAWSLNGHSIKDSGPQAGSSVKARLCKATLTIQQADFHSQFGQAGVTGTISNLDTTPVMALKMSSEVDLAAVRRTLASHGFHLSSDWQITGRPRLVDVTVDGPTDRLKARGSVGLGGVTVAWRGADVFWRRECPEFRWAVSCEKGRVRVDEIFFRSRGGELVLGPSVPGKPGLNGHAALNLDEFKPIISAMDDSTRALVRGSNLPPTAKALAEGIQEDFRVTGSVRFPALSIQEVEGGLRFYGTTDMTPLAVTYRDIALKSPTDAVRSDLDVTLKEEEIILNSATLDSSIGATRLSGRLDLSRSIPHLEMRLRTSGDFQRLISFVPIGKVTADTRLNQALKDIGVDLAEMDKEFDIAGMVSLEMRFSGTPEEVSWNLDGDLSGLDVTYSGAFRKPTRQYCEVKFAGRATPKTFVLSSASLDIPGGKVRLEGDIVVSPPAASGTNVKIFVGDTVLDTSFKLSHLRPGGFWLDSGRLRWGPADLGFDGPIMCEPAVIRADTLRVFVNKSVLNVRLVVRDYYGDNPVFSAWVRGAALDLRPVFPAKAPASPLPEVTAKAKEPPQEPAKAPAKTASKAPEPSSAPSEAAPADDLALAASPNQPKEFIKYMRRARIYISFFLGRANLDLYDGVDRTPGVRRYEVRDISFELNQEKGLLRAEAVFAFNNGSGDAIINVDFNRDAPRTILDAWADSISADDDLRPILNMIFPNLYVDGSLSGRVRSRWDGLTVADMSPTCEGESILAVKKGHMLGKAAPDYILKVFPGLNLYDYRFDACEVVTKTHGIRATNKITFSAPTFNLYMEGQSNNQTREVDYICGMDLVSNMGLDGARNHIPKLLQDGAKVTIVRYRGRVDDQHAEWFTPKMETIANTVRQLLPIRSVEVLASPDKTAGQKMDYFWQKIRRLLLLPVKAGERVAGVQEKKEDRWDKAQPPPKITQNEAIPKK